MVIQYQCPSCGADLHYDSQSGMLSCDSCGHTMPVSQYQESSAQRIEEFGENEGNQYQCQNCGAILITDLETTATNCSFCGAPMVLGDRLSGELRPAKIIPFSISKEQAQEAFRKWCHKGRLTPKGFMTADRVKNITGMYVPFWIYDLNSRGEIHAECTRRRTYESNEYIYTETRFYDVYRKVDLNYCRVPADASKKMDDSMMDALEPYQYQDMKVFHTPYLAGYVAEKYDENAQELFPRVKQRIEQYASQYMRSTINGYQTTSVRSQRIDVKQESADYTLLPVWMICYSYEQKDYMFAMNGQTGKIVGKPPISKGKAAAWFGGITGALFVILECIFALSGGVVL